MPSQCSCLVGDVQEGHQVDEVGGGGDGPGASQNVIRPPALVPLLDDDEGEAGPVVLLQVHASLPDGQQLELEHCVELYFGESVPIHHDLERLEPCFVVEVDHVREGADDVLPRHLDADHGAVGGVHGADQCCDAWLPIVSWGCVTLSPMKMTGTRKSWGRYSATRMVLTRPCCSWLL